MLRHEPELAGLAEQVPSDLTLLEIGNNDALPAGAQQPGGISPSSIRALKA
jgi:hypothetical protein